MKNVQINIRYRCQKCERGIIENPEWVQFYENHPEARIAAQESDWEVFDKIAGEYFGLQSISDGGTYGDYPPEEIDCPSCEGSQWIYGWVDAEELMAELSSKSIQI